MFRIEEVTTKKGMKDFVDFANDLYKGCPYYVPPFYGEETGLNSLKKNPSLKDVEAKFWLCYDEDVIVGRICAILQFAYNEKNNKNCIRFTRYDVIDDVEVSKLLFNEVFKFAKERGMNQVHGPLGFSDSDREGLIVEGFDSLVTFSNAYNYDYYEKHLNALGFAKEVDWLEFKIFIPKEADPRYDKMSALVKKRYKLYDAADGKSINYIVKNYGKKIFELLNVCYGDLHGFVHMSDEVVEGLISMFKIAANPRYISLVCDENGRLVGMGIALASIAKAMQKCKGKLFPFGFIPVLKELKKPDVIELVFIAIDDEYKNKGLNAIMFSKIMKNAIEDGIVHAESNSELEENKRVQAIFKNFDLVNHRRRRCLIKTLEE